MPCAFCLDRASAGNSSPARIAMIAMTTSNSIRVKPCSSDRAGRDGRGWQGQEVRRGFSASSGRGNWFFSIMVLERRARPVPAASGNMADVLPGGLGAYGDKPAKNGSGRFRSTVNRTIPPNSTHSQTVEKPWSLGGILRARRHSQSPPQPTAIGTPSTTRAL